MKPNNIIYADLSTYLPEETMSFYENVFGWKYYRNENTHYAYSENDLVAGLYQTPKFFQKINMPHFWMTYIQVNDLASTVSKARELNGIIELEKTIPDFGKVALIRDVQGAGFTIYEGDNLSSVKTENKPYTLIWNELHVSDIQNVIPFYVGIFNWTFRQVDDAHYMIHNHIGAQIADVLEIANEVKGKYEYWICTFGVQDLKEATSNIKKYGGGIISDEGNKILCTDNSGQAFFYLKECT